MMAAAQPFLSGAISKTVNLPNNATRKDIEDIYLEGWKLGLKAIAVYRDGSKMSQPLSSKAENPGAGESSEDLSQASAQRIEHILPKVLARAEQLGIHPGSRRRALPKKRRGFTVEAKIGGQKIYVRTGEFEDGGLAEVFLDMHKEGAAFRSMLNCLAIAVSKGLQHGIPLEEFVESFTFTRFEPNGVVDHDNIKSATSVVDFVFRLLGMEYLGRTDFVHVMPRPAAKRAAPAAPTEAAQPGENTGAQSNAGLLMGDAPACTSCGHTTVRNGACYRCLNCGTSLGCS
jgi:ribonucleoside-diphosphate reductase alpha chain